MSPELMVNPNSQEVSAQVLRTIPINEAGETSPLQTEQPTIESRATTSENIKLGSLVQILAVKRQFLERQPSKKTNNGAVKLKPGRAPGRDLTGNDLIGAVGKIIQLPDAKLVPNNADQLVMARVGDEVLYLHLSEIAPFVPEPVRD